MANRTPISERRLRRAVIHPCQHCGHEPEVVTRTPQLLYRALCDMRRNLERRETGAAAIAPRSIIAETMSVVAGHDIAASVAVTH